MFVYELSGCGFDSSCSHLIFRYHACFEQGVPWHSGNYRVWIHSETRTWHNKNIKLIANLHDKTEYVIHIRNLKQVLNHGLAFEKVHKVIKFNKNALLKPYIDMNTDLRKKAKHNFEKDFFKLMNNEVFGKSMEKC